MEEKSTLNSDVEATKQIYDIAREEADLEMTKLRATIEMDKEASFCLGAIKANKAYRDYSAFLDAVVLYRMHKSKEYKKAGLTWEEFCEAAGYPRRTAETIITDVAPFFAVFAQNLPVLAGINIHDIRWLGKIEAANAAALSEDGKTLIIGDDLIPATTEDIIAYINHQREIHQQAIEEKEATLSATKKVMADKEKLINKQELAIKRLEKRVDLSELTDEEQDAINLLSRVEMDFLQGMSDIKKQIKPHEAPVIALRSYYMLLLFINKWCTDEREALNETYREAEECPWEIMDQEIPDTAVVLDNLPTFVGRGIGVLYQAKIDARKAKAEARRKGKANQEGGADAEGQG